MIAVGGDYNPHWKMSAEVKKEIQLEVAHVLFTDIVAYSKLLSDEQRRLFELLNEIVRNTSQFRAAEVAGELVRSSTGDGIVLAFFTTVDVPVRCALEISRKLCEHPELKLRMGINSGPVDQVFDVNNQRNITGVGINMAKRVMDCGDAGHILLSKRVADDLAQYSEWEPYLHELGQVEVKHGVRLDVVNFYDNETGNPTLPTKLKLAARKRSTRNWTVVAAVALIAALSFVFLRIGLRGRFGGTDLSVFDKSIAVLPFENLSAEKENAFFADGVQNEILSDLAKIADLKVISRTSVLPYKAGNPRNLREIGQQLGVAHVLEGSVQRAGTKVRVSAQLVDARTDKHVWVGTYDRELVDVFSIETELAQAIAGELQARLTTGEKAAIEEKPTQDLVAYDLYVRAVSLIYNAQVPFQEELVNRSEAVDLLNKAVARDPNFFLAYYQLAFLHDLVYQQESDHTPARLALAQSAIDSTFRLRPDSGEAHLALGWHLYWGYSDYDRARAELAVAQQSLPNNPRVYELAGLIGRRQGRWTEATHNLERACELDPRNLPYLITLSTTYLWLHDYEQMARVMDRIIALHPDRRPARIWRGWIAVAQRADTAPFHAAIEKILTNEPESEKDLFVAGRRLDLALYDRDLDAAGRLAAALPQKDGRDFWLGVVARSKGDEASARAAFMRARTELEEELRAHPDDFGLLSDLGMIDAALGRKEEALSEGRRAMELVPMAQEAMTGPYNNEGFTRRSFAVICAWTGEYDLAIEQLETLGKIPGGPSYGDLRLSPLWDPLRGDPRFEKIVEESKQPVALK
jgi:TolB-like protein/class 3 adenylate cyclase/Tfp pilus assembly protein PilF